MSKQVLKMINEKRRSRILAKEISALESESFSIISSDCIGGILYHDLHKKFLSPTINLSIFGNTFLTFCKHLEYFLSQELEFVTTKKPHPVAILKGPSEEEVVKINFVHYQTKENAQESWNKRKSRINFKQLFFIYNIDDVDCKTVSQIDNLIKRGYRFFVICRKNSSEVERPYIHISSFLNSHKHDSGKLISFKFLSGKRNFDDLKIYDFIINNIKQ